MHKIGDKVVWEGKMWIIDRIQDRNTYEPLINVKQLGNVVIIKDSQGNKVAVYDFDL